ncbi:MAG: ATP adenylyltransferase family protein [Nitrospirales bacterium]
MTRRFLWFEPHTLWGMVRERTAHALQCGAMQPLPTSYEIVEDTGVRFIIRLLRSLTAKAQAHATQPRSNPFLPYDENLFVADISDTHLCLLNKFNVMDYHLLIVTRAFEEQETLLTVQDFEAWLACLGEMDGLGFYNGGQEAGASQRHKHLQVVPLPLAPEGPSIPIEPLLASAQYKGPIGTAPGLPWLHAIARMDSTWTAQPANGAHQALQTYYALLRAVGMLEGVPDPGQRQRRPYNVLLTRKWMWLVPRSQECVDSISVNALGFAGALLVNNERQMALIKERKPMTVLKLVSLSAL